MKFKEFVDGMPYKRALSRKLIALKLGVSVNLIIRWENGNKILRKYHENISKKVGSKIELN